MSWAPRATQTCDDAVRMTILECRRCERRWLVAGDHRVDAGRPCPHCTEGTVSVVSAFADRERLERDR